MLTQKDVLLNKLYDVKYDRIEQGLGLDVAEVDEYLRFKKGAFNICVGHANTGKTTTILYMMMAYSIKHSLKWLIFSSENTDYSIARKLLEFKTQMPIQQLPDADIESELNWINSHFKIINVDKIYTARTLMSEAKAIRDAWEYDGLLVDPYNSLAKDAQLLRSVGGHEYDYQIASEMRLFCKENNVSMWLNCHAVTEALRRVHDKDHVYAGFPKPPSMADVEGGGKWGNRADDVIAIHRYTQHPDRWMVSDIHVRKVKETETGGRPTSMDAPISLRMMPSNVSFTVAGRELIAKQVKKTNTNFDSLEF
jgi:replicative DNA helicase